MKWLRPIGLIISEMSEFDSPSLGDVTMGAVEHTGVHVVRYAHTLVWSTWKRWGGAVPGPALLEAKAGPAEA